TIVLLVLFFFFQAEDGIRDFHVTGVQTCALPISALKTIELLERELVANSAEVGAYLKSGLEKLMAKYDCIGDVRGMGMMIGVEFVKDRASKEPDPDLRDRVEMETFNRGVILLGCG